MRTAFKVATNTPWAIEEGALATILAIANREHGGLAAVEAARGEKLQNTRSVTIRDGVAVIPVVGPIMRHASMFSDISGAVSVEAIAQDLSVAMSDPKVSAVLLSFDSPGGEVTGINELAGMIRSASARKPVEAYVGGSAASAAYWLASATSRIAVDATARLGSIGVVAAVPNPSAGSAADIEIVSSQSPNKRPDVTTDEGKATIQSGVDSLAAIFIDAVAAYRGTTAKTVANDFGKGGSLIGKAAVAAGMADAVSSFEATLKGAANRGKQAARKGMQMQVSSVLGLSETAGDQDISDRAKELVAMESKLLASTGAKTTAEASGTIEAWKADAARLAEVNGQLQALKAEREQAVATEQTASLEALIESARKEGKLNAPLESAVRSMALSYKQGAISAQGLESARGMVAALQPIAAFAASPVLGGTASVGEGDGDPDVVVTYQGKTWAQMSEGEKHRLGESNPKLFKTMHQQARR